MKELKAKVTAAMTAAGADIVVCGNVDRFRDPAVKKLFPETKTVICAAFRQLRGSRRGVEDGTTYYQYTTSVETLEEVVMPQALLRGCAVLEEAGFDALPQRRPFSVIKAVQPLTWIISAVGKISSTFSASSETFT